MSIHTIDTDATVWPFRPNWSAPLVETLEWNTSVVASYNGNEQRTALRARPRVLTDFSFWFSARAAKRLDNLLWARQNRRLATPQWQFVTPTTSESAAAQNVVELDTTQNGLVVDQWVLLYRNFETFEAGQIASMDGTSITLVDPLTDTWPAGTKVYPLHFAYIEGDVPLQRETDRVTAGAVRFLSDPVTTDPFIPSAVAPFSYNSYEILLTKPDWNGGIDAPQTYPLDKIDFGVGAVEYTRTVTAPSIARGFRWLHKSRAAAIEFREFLGRRVGRQKAFYAPTWTDDLTLAGNVASDATEINCREELLGELVGLDPTRTHIYIRLKSGTTYLRQITSVTPAGSAVTLGINAALGALVTPDDVKAIHFVPLWRLASDSVAIQWFSPNVAVVDTPLVLVKP